MGRRIEVGIAALPFILHFQQSGTSRGGERKKVNLYLQSKRFSRELRARDCCCCSSGGGDDDGERAPSSSRSQVCKRNTGARLLVFAVKFIRESKISGAIQLKYMQIDGRRRRRRHESRGCTAAAGDFSDRQPANKLPNYREISRRIPGRRATKRRGEKSSRRSNGTSSA